MHVACSTNKQFIQHMCVMLQSLITNTNENVFVHILHTELDENDQYFIQNLFKNQKKITVNFYHVEKNLLENIPIIADSLTIETLFRLLLPMELPVDIDKVLYIDSDIVIKDDIYDIYKIDLKNYYLAAVVDVYEKILETIKFDNILNYFNAGFILINLKKWREEKFLDRCLKFANQYPERIQLADQDVLNGVLNGEWMRLPLKWNLVRNFVDNKENYYKYFSHEEIEDALNNPSIIHYTSAKKPWKLLDDHPYKEEYFIYLDELDINYDRKADFKYLTNKQVVLFGTGQASLQLSEICQNEGINIMFYVDNDSKKWNGSFNNKVILNPNILKENKENYFIIIASQYIDEIGKQLSDYGYKSLWEGKAFHSIE
ncbi:glycosyltransferase family 8 protein [Lysinibacillus piscis]|uniref:Glycosyltransferase family 8 protein n=1 Tax=Lysinibacillus piscis TaxID=2518931 RepID=A0ABQ5NHK3_9BACI|nr:glycosyltransferase family 8 protein [Lysinibacillus sp. KH24]GLC87812.1 hypothetical protein LYSBPC_09390 [Lysinibacillus sp. KH24]